jgi:hypothetical protein
LACGSLANVYFSKTVERNREWRERHFLLLTQEMGVKKTQNGGFSLYLNIF